MEILIMLGSFIWKYLSGELKELVLVDDQKSRDKDYYYFLATGLGLEIYYKSFPLVKENEFVVMGFSWWNKNEEILVKEIIKKVNVILHQIYKIRQRNQINLTKEDFKKRRLIMNQDERNESGKNTIIVSWKLQN